MTDMMPSAKSKPDRASETGYGSNRLDRESWVNAAWKALGAGSVENIKVDRLARQLKVTRGSFYWHFKDKEDLINCVIDKWIDKLGVFKVMAPMLEDIESPTERIWKVYEQVLMSVDGPQSIVLRVWSRKSGKVLERMRSEDETRTSHFQQLFVEAGFSQAEAALRAEAYFALVMSEYLRNGTLPMATRLKLARRQHSLLVAQTPNADADPLQRSAN